MADFKQIKRQCAQKDKLWEDPDFPASNLCVFHHQMPPFKFQWLRPKEIYQNPIFVCEDRKQFDVVQGRMGKLLGDQWVVSSFGLLYNTEGLFYRVVPADQDFGEDYRGVFRFRLWWCGTWQEVLVDDRLPTLNGKLVFVQSRKTTQVWPALLEKAYAKLNGSYEALKYGTVMDALPHLTGGITEQIQLERAISINALKMLLSYSSIITCVFTSPNDAVIDNACGVQTNINYIVLELNVVQSSGGPLHVVRLLGPVVTPRNETAGSLMFDIEQLNKIPSSEKERLNKVGEGFWILFNDMFNTFSHLQIVHLDVETCKVDKALSEKKHLYMKIGQGVWRRGVSAGGCKLFPDFYHINPQFQFQIESSNPNNTAIISLTQHSVTDAKVIGFSLYCLSGPMTEVANEDFFKNNKIAFHTHYINGRHVTKRCGLEAGTYVVVPSTYEPRQEGSFTLRVYANVRFTMKAVDSDPKMLKSAITKAPIYPNGGSLMQYESMFTPLADDQKTVDPFLLQEVLEACLPNDYVKSCSTLDTCKQIVLALDTKGNGRITLQDFKDLVCSLKNWEAIFKNYSRERTGVIRAERLRDALKDIGFVLPEKVVATLILRYMKKDGLLRFGDFVSAILQLHRAFNAVEMKESAVSGYVTMSLTEWLRCSIMI